SMGEFRRKDQRLREWSHGHSEVHRDKIGPCARDGTQKSVTHSRRERARIRHSCVSATRSGLRSVPNHVNAWWKQSRFNLKIGRAQSGLEIKFEPLIGIRSKSTSAGGSRVV